MEVHLIIPQLGVNSYWFHYPVYLFDALLQSTDVFQWHGALFFLSLQDKKFWASFGLKLVSCSSLEIMNDEIYALLSV